MEIAYFHQKNLALTSNILTLAMESLELWYRWSAKHALIFILARIF